MDLQAFYEEVGGSYEEVLKRLRNEERIKKYLFGYLEETEYRNLANAYSMGDWKAFFLAAHTMKGLCANLGMMNLAKAASDLTENIRGLSPNEKTPGLYEKITAEYKHAIVAIRNLQEG